MKTIELPRGDINGFTDDCFSGNCVTVCCITSSVISEEVFETIKKSVVIKYLSDNPDHELDEEDLEWEKEDKEKGVPFKFLSQSISKNPSDFEIKEAIHAVHCEDTNIVIIDDICLHAGITIYTELMYSYPIIITLIYEENQGNKIFKDLKILQSR